MEDLLFLKRELERPGIGRHKHEIADKFKDRKDVPIKWIREWLNSEWYVVGHQYLWLAAMNACIDRPNVPHHILYQGLCKTDPSTFNAAIEACRERKIPFPVIRWWYNSPRIPLQIAALTACIDNQLIPRRFICQAKSHKDARVRNIVQKILG